MIRRLTTCFAALALTLAVTSTSQAVIEISMPQVQVFPGDTSARVILYVNGTDTVRSVNPALEISTMMGTGSATFAGPDSSLDIQTATKSAANGGPLDSTAVWPTGVTNPALTQSPPPTNVLRKYNLDNGVTTASVSGAQQLLALDIALSGVTAGSVYQIDLLADIDGDNISDSTWVGSDTSNTLSLGALNGERFGKIVAVPEPSSFVLFGLVGCVCYAGNWARRRWFTTAGTE